MIIEVMPKWWDTDVGDISWNPQAHHQLSLWGMANP